MCTFEQISQLFTNLTNQFTKTIDNLIDKFENFNKTKLDRFETNIFTMSEQIDALEAKIDSMQKSNKALKELLVKNHVDSIKVKEEELADNFSLIGIQVKNITDSSEVIKDLPTLVFNNFTKNVLAIKDSIDISNAKLTKIYRKENDNLFKLSATLSNSSDWKSIFNNLKNLKGTNIVFMKDHSNEVSAILKEFREIIYKERLKNNKNCYIKNLSLHNDGVITDVFSVIRQRFLKSLLL